MAAINCSTSRTTSKLKKLYKDLKIFKINTTNREQFTIKRNRLEEDDDFTYLGNVIDKQGGIDADVRARIGKAARGLFIQLNRIWNSNQISRKTKIRL